jgi:hypothetical protein
MSAFSSLSGTPFQILGGVNTVQIHVIEDPHPTLQQQGFLLIHGRDGLTEQLQPLPYPVRLPPIFHTPCGKIQF